MDDTVLVEIPVSRDVANLLKNRQNRDRLGELVSKMLRPVSAETDPLAALITELKADAQAAGLTDKEIDAELAAYNAERRL
jgi:hypothetical protein